MTPAIQVKLLTAHPHQSTAGKAQAKTVAQWLADHVQHARQTVNIAIYDFRLAEPEASIVINALQQRADAGVTVRVAYFEQPARSTYLADFTSRGGDPMPGADAGFIDRLVHPRIVVKKITEADIQSLGNAVNVRPVAGGGHLMHSKYVICDGLSPAASVWTGSANFTTDAWSIQDNNIVIIRSQSLAGHYETDFAELWDAQHIAGTGKNDSGKLAVGKVGVNVAFAPGDGAAIDHQIAAIIGAARSHISLASMVVSSGTILGALLDALERGVKLTGIYDGPEMHQVIGAWQKSTSAASQTKLQNWETIATHLVAKKSTPYTDTGPHDFMHNKCVAVDASVVVTGSFNFSQNAIRNAENVLVLSDAHIAQEYETYIASLVQKYGK